MVLVGSEVGFEERPGPDQRHLTDQHIDQLRQLVQAPASEHAAKPSCARIIANLEEARVAGVIQVGKLLLLDIGAFSHRPELDHLEPPSAQSRPLLEEEGRAGRIEPDRYRDCGEEGSEEGQQSGAYQYVDNTLRDEGSRLKHRASELEKGLIVVPD